MAVGSLLAMPERYPSSGSSRLIRIHNIDLIIHLFVGRKLAQPLDEELLSTLGSLAAALGTEDPCRFQAQKSGPISHQDPPAAGGGRGARLTLAGSPGTTCCPRG